MPQGQTLEGGSMCPVAMEDNRSDEILPVVNRWQERQDNIMKCHRYRRSNFVASTQPCYRDGKQCLQAPKRGEAKENADGRAQCDRMRRVGNRHQGHVMLDQPLLEPDKRFRQARAVTSRGLWFWSGHERM